MRRLEADGWGPGRRRSEGSGRQGKQDGQSVSPWSAMGKFGKASAVPAPCGEWKVQAARGLHRSSFSRAFALTLTWRLTPPAHC